jgi:hypothetical protein
VTPPPPTHRVGNIAYGMDTSHNLNIFVIGSDRTLQHSVQVAPAGRWSSWSTIAPVQLYHRAGVGYTTSTFPTQEVYQVLTAWSRGKLQAFVRGRDYCVLSVCDVIGSLDSAKIRAVGDQAEAVGGQPGDRPIALHFAPRGCGSLSGLVRLCGTSAFVTQRGETMTDTRTRSEMLSSWAGQ